MPKIQQRECSPLVWPLHLFRKKKKEQQDPFLTVHLNKWGHLLGLLFGLVSRFPAQGTGSSVICMLSSVCTTHWWLLSSHHFQPGQG